MFTKPDFEFARTIAELNYTNPFSAERLEMERRALGDDYEVEPHLFWSLIPGEDSTKRGNILKLTRRTEQLAEEARRQILAGESVEDGALAVYDDLIVYLLFYQSVGEWRELIAGGDAGDASRQWERFNDRFDHWLKLPGVALPSAGEKAHLFALLYQVYRAFVNIFDCVVGQSRAAASLRSSIWQSIFTHDVRRYRRSLYSRLHEITTLVTGPSGSGKELVAQAIGRSRYIPFSFRKRQFETSALTSYVALNISAFSVNLIESELFGSIKGAYTGAETARAGWLETCGAHGSILLDEIGELDATTQVKLLRVLQNRQYSRLGESKLREFHGKVLAATNRDLRREIRKGTFREDLYYRLCADVITTPPLAEYVQGDPASLGELVRFISRRIAPGEESALAEQVIEWIGQHLPTSYHWPGNIRELEQCVRNIMIRNHYQPDSSDGSEESADPAEKLARRIANVQLTADELLTEYARIALKKSASFKQAAELLGIDRRTLRARVGDP